MNGLVRLALMTLFCAGMAPSFDQSSPAQALIESVQAEQDVPLTLEPTSPFWRDARPVFIEKDKFGKPVARDRSEVRTRWTRNDLYFLFICPYEELYLKPDPTTQRETNKLWNWDVAEAFIGSDFENIQRYKEFEVSPQGEWVDLDIDLSQAHHEEGWTWNSGMQAAAHVNEGQRLWYAAMRIPYSSIDARPAKAGNELRINLFVSQGPPQKHRQTAWQSPMQDSFHVPEKFGVLRLVSK